MYGAGDQLLAGPRLTVNQRAPAGRRGVSDLLPQRAHRRRVSDHRVTALELLLQLRVRRFEFALADRVFDGEDGLFQRERLLDEIEGAELRGAHGHVDPPMDGDHDDACVGVIGFKSREGFEAVDSRQPDVEQHAGVKSPLEGLQTLFAARRRGDREAFVFEHSGERLPNAGFVVNYENRMRHTTEWAVRPPQTPAKVRLNSVPLLIAPI